MNKNTIKAPCTILLAAVNVIVFLVLSFLGMTEDGEFMLKHGAMYVPYLIQRGEYYRLFSSMFLHFGYDHLVNNMIVLVAMGWNLELDIGKVKFLIVYFVSGLAGNVLSAWWDIQTGSMAISAGASGAIFGIIGALLYVAIRNRGRIGDISGRGLVFMIVLTLYYGFTSGGVDNMAHIGGLLAGFLSGVLLYRKRKDKYRTGMNYLLIFGKCGFPMLGVEGAAIATLLSRVAEFVVCLICALRSRVIPLDWKALARPGGEMLRRFVKYSSPVLVNELFWGLGNSLLTVILGHTVISVEFLAANAVMGNLNRLFLVVCFGLGAATAVMVGKAIGEGQRREELMALSRTLSWVTILVGVVLAVVALALVPLLFQPVIFPLFKLEGLSAHLATTLAVTGFACIPFHAYSISAVTGILRAGGDVFWSTAACSTSSGKLSHCSRTSLTGCS